MVNDDHIRYGCLYMDILLHIEDRSHVFLEWTALVKFECQQ